MLFVVVVFFMVAMIEDSSQFFLDIYLLLVYIFLCFWDNP